MPHRQNHNEQVLELIGEGYTQRQIAMKLQISEAAVSKICKKLERLNLIRVKVKSSVKSFVKVKLSSVKFTHDLASVAPLGMTQPLAKLQLHAHRFQKNYKLLAKPAQASMEDLREEGGIHYGQGFRITKNILELEGLEVWSDYNVPISILLATLNTQSDNIACAISKQYGLDIGEAATPPKLTEIELTEHALAEQVDEKGKIPLHYDADMKPDVWMDKSFGLGGLESNTSTYIQRLTNMTRDIVEHNGWEELKGDLAQAARLLNYYAKNMESHAKLVKQAGSLIKELRQERKGQYGRNQRRL